MTGTLTLGVLEGGLFHGLPSFFIHHLVFDRHLAKIREVNSKCRSLIIINPEKDPSISTIATLREEGYRIGIVWDGQTFPNWSQWIDYRIVVPKQEEWLGCMAHEVRISTPPLDPRKVTRAMGTPTYSIYTDTPAAADLDDTREWRILPEDASFFYHNKTIWSP